MADIVLVGLNHQTAPVELRECLAFSSEETAGAVERLHQSPSVNEVLLLSTCNRVEILMVSENRENAVETAKTYLSEFKSISVSEFEGALYIHHGDEAVRHIFRVASSLDSMIIGEPQIMGQIKEAYRTATRNKTSGVILNRLLHKTFFVAKRVRSETGIGDHAVSISYAAIELGRKIFGILEGKKVLLIGAGEMAELAVEHLKRDKIGDVFVANRTFDRGLALAEKFSGKAIRFEEIAEHLLIADIVISSTGSPDFIITRNHIKGMMRNRKNRPIFFVDIAVPRDIDPNINRLTNAYVYDIDDLKGVIDENIEDRKKEAVKGERIVDEAVIRFRQWYNNLDVIPTIVALRKKVEAIADAEIRKTVTSMSHLSEKDLRALNRMKHALIKKILHGPTLFLKSDGSHGNKTDYLDTTRKLFRLDKQEYQED